MESIVVQQNQMRTSGTPLKFSLVLLPYIPPPTVNGRPAKVISASIDFYVFQQGFILVFQFFGAFVDEMSSLKKIKEINQYSCLCLVPEAYVVSSTTSVEN